MPEIDGFTQLYGLLANPARHSLSPKIMNESFKVNKVNAKYLVFEPASADLAITVSGLKAAGIGGFNLSMPFKQAVIPLLDELTPRAALLQAVNVVNQVDGRLIGDTVDGAGFVANLKSQHIDLTGKRVVLLGAGGAGRAVLEALSHEPLQQITVVKRQNARFKDVATLIKQLQVTASMPIQLVDYQTANLVTAFGDMDLLINSTNIGMKSHDLPFATSLTQLLHPGQVVTDMIYAPLETELLNVANQQGCQTIPGLGMLVAQAAASFNWWTNTTMPVTHINQLLKDGLKI
ncbi:shikimate dehydrogenase [Furfurilactobacillus siliginis]|uniref:Shikimate dehydrogenase (NADP(+)) n=1 Tax=Furfurilactobacillus siliginis TaxID=348151 RepID=A0A0R2L1S9_9LACO|nr:shikimate dehydrogenase [Furfurilactobacillus siliginis]KRN95768.1 shikimate dehydrogenase 1 [Furfurilactobacillus siliginis]GEK28956.1 shikimate dehydrogenase (NADP(+)) [Furfurilactobacillus siliginis]